MYDQYTRLTEFRRDHPAVVIDRDDFGKWQARIPPQSGERFTGTFLGGRDELRSLLDDLDEIVDPGDPMSSG